MKHHIVLRLLGILLLLESLSMAICGLFGLFLPSNDLYKPGVALFSSAGITLIVSLVLILAFNKKIDHLPKREGLILVGITWIIFGLFGAIPFMIGGPTLSFADAYFESVSGFTATGATIINDLSLWPNDILLWRATSQWLGGLGILVLFMALLSSLGAGSKFLFKNESSFQTSEFSAVKIKDIVLVLLGLYLLMTVFCAGGLKAFGMTWFESITHSFTTVSTAGFSIYNESIGYFREWETAWLIESWLTLCMLISSLSFVFYIVLWKRNFARARQMEELFVYLGILTIGFITLLCSESAYIEDGNYIEWIRRSLFMTVSLSTTTGFGLITERDWPAYTVPLVTVLMMIGGCAGSTAGGIKVSRIITLWKSTKHALIQAFRPHQYLQQKINGRTIDKDAASLVILFIAINLSVLFLSTIIVTIIEHRSAIDFETAFGASVACLANVGPGWGEVGIWGNFSNLHGTTKVFLSVVMILGRLELFALLALFTPTTWKKF